jgi:D-arabinose 1-dehydrogenase-like Zn-dependent alcohol dehydrogenase
MRAVRFENKQVIAGEAPRPTGGDVLVRVRACGICGPDVSVLDSGFLIFGIPGHEIAGELEEGAAGAIRVVLEP